MKLLILIGHNKHQNGVGDDAWNESSKTHQQHKGYADDGRINVEVVTNATEHTGHHPIAASTIERFDRQPAFLARTIKPAMAVPALPSLIADLFSTVGALSHGALFVVAGGRAGAVNLHQGNTDRMIGSRK